jgi:hypothetical protein
MQQKNLFEQIFNQVCSKKLPEIFTVKDIVILERSPSFLSKHAIGNPGNYTPYFERVSVGKYKINSKYKNCSQPGHLR